MTNIATALKAEITRVARKEIRAEVDGLKTASTEHRKAIAALRRQVKELESQLKRASKASGRAAPAKSPEADQAGMKHRFSAKRLAAHRAKLGLSAADYGKLVGVSGQSIYKWEQGTVRPRPAQIEALAVVRGMGKRDVAERLVG